ncbi:MAG: SemiSWEET transporter [Candidatus Margulisbacteria bacterium]|nr:SemiSWEET transporter [Candidatus Margulisiibacteriota bacterium]MBU1617686.1 SemiSWEET transporter [Candidatus Margulisiibacteriota bacterium]MBU1867077.1 SemiSWEET transporter [Candidatus Margulisiibacteriota bacterium]
MEGNLVLGIIAGALTTISFLPQVIKTYSTRHTKDISLLMYLLFSCGLILWTVYGFRVGSFPVIAANSFTLILAFFIILMKIRHG